MSLRARLLAAFAYALLVVIVALEVPLASNLDSRVRAEVEADSATQAQVVAASVTDQLSLPARLNRVSAQASQRLGGRVFIVDGRGRLLADSSGLETKGSIFASESHPPLLRALNGEIAQGTHEPDTDELSTAVPIVRGGRTIGALEVEQSLDAVNREVREDVLALVAIGLLALALGLGVAWILAGSIARPLHSLAAAARRMAGGDLDARAPTTGSSEQVDVATAFNEMADRLGSVLESQRAFVADASHQLRTPLTGLRLRLEAAAAKSPGDAQSDLEAADRETERLSQVIDDLLDLASSEEPSEGGSASLERAAADAESRWRDPADDSGRRLQLCEAPDVAVRAGPRDLALILDNLIENAIKYSPRGSTIRIEWAADDCCASLRVLSGGDPLGEEERERAFERFYRGGSSRRKPGTGLGLPVVAALARRAGGSAEIGNRDEGGVVAQVSLPVAEGDFADS
ncbi:MAG: HAMP domain-containing histidine kinase [Actinobacteria bacterium]|nr:HAMP domain-containing histidine kinase [Actinomycetota bacterium]